MLKRFRYSRQLTEATAKGQGLALSMIDCSRAVLFNGLARYLEATA